MAFLRLVVFGFLILSVIYLSISLYSRSVRREKLEDHWDEKHPGSTDREARDAFIERGMAEYETGFRKKLILLVYVVPTVAIGLILYFTNY